MKCSLYSLLGFVIFYRRSFMQNKKARDSSFPNTIKFLTQNCRTEVFNIISPLLPPDLQLTKRSSQVGKYLPEGTHYLNRQLRDALRVRILHVTHSYIWVSQNISILISITTKNSEEEDPLWTCSFLRQNVFRMSQKCQYIVLRDTWRTCRLTLSTITNMYLSLSMYMCRLHLCGNINQFMWKMLSTRECC